MQRRDRGSLWEAVAMAVAFVLFVAGVIYLRGAVPCGWVDWMPAAEVPARCI